MAVPSHCRPKVLVAHDDRVIAETLRLILVRSGFDTICVFTGQHAIDAAHGWQPHIFLSEALMPEVSGIEAATRIRAMHPDCRVLLFSGEEAIPAHPFQCLLKPVPPHELVKHLRSALRRLPATA
jgi:DNA-binding response OmpR family regulator